MSDSRTVSLRILVPIAACVAVLGLAACGDDDETTSSPATVPAETTGAETTDTWATCPTRRRCASSSTSSCSRC